MSGARTSSCRSSRRRTRGSAAWTRRSRSSSCAPTSSTSSRCARSTTATASSRTSRSCRSKGDYTAFAFLETPMLGTLARRTLITTNVVHVLEATNGKPLIFMPARHDHHRIQTGDGYAAHVAGVDHGRRDRRDDERAGVVVGRPRRRHRAARTDRVVRRRHGAGSAEVRGLGAARHERHGARRLRERLGPHRARGRRCARRPPVGRAARHGGGARRPLALGRDGRLQADSA